MEIMEANGTVEQPSSKATLSRGIACRRASGPVRNEIDDVRLEIPTEDHEAPPISVNAVWLGNSGTAPRTCLSTDTVT